MHADLHLPPTDLALSPRAKPQNRLSLVMKNVARAAMLGAWSLACRGLSQSEKSHYTEPAAPSVFARTLRVAVVKQTTFSDLYSLPKAKTTRELLESSWHRIGPIGLFQGFQSEFFIVHPEPDTECRIGEVKQNYARADAVRARDDAQRQAAQEAVAVRADEVDWSAFDLVLAIENAVPARITRRHPGVLWATLLEHHRMACYRDYLRLPPAGYDAFFNLRYGPNPQSLGRRPHVIDWPYGFSAPRSLSSLYPEITKEPLVFVEDHQPAAVKKALDLAGVLWEGGRLHAISIAEFARGLVRAKVFFAVQPSRPLGGLAAIDAVSAGAVVLANRSHLWNSSLITKETNWRNLGDAARFTRSILDEPQLYTRLIAEQEGRLRWFCHERPLRQLAALIGGIPRALSARDHLVA
jgi:hypothetical protein